MRKAGNLHEIYQAFQGGRPLAIRELDQFYQPTTEARGGNPRQRMARTLRNNLFTHQHILFIGYRGCGKSTELNHLQRDLQDEILVINYSVQEELDPMHITYIELFIVNMERLFTTARELKLKINKKYLEAVTEWLVTPEIVEIREKYNIGAEAEIGGGVTASIPFLAEFFGKFKATAKSSRSLKETLKRNVEPRLSDLIQFCNDLIREIKLNLNRIGKKDLLLVIEDLDKIPLDRAESLFFNHTQQLVQIQANVIYTFPVALYFHLRFNTIKPYFSDCRELPMIRVRHKNGDVDQRGVQTMRDIVFARMDESLFSDLGDLNGMIGESGGCLRDLFLMIVEAAENAQDYERERIVADDCRSAHQRLKREYENNIADYVLDDKVIVPVENYFEVLVQLANSPEKKVDNTLEALHLRQNLSILGYNGEQWYDVHPIVRTILEERGRL